MAQPFSFELVTPEKLVVSEQVLSVVVPGAEGEFTVLAQHAPVMTTLRAGKILVTNEQNKMQEYEVKGGFADVNTQGLTILAS